MIISPLFKISCEETSNHSKNDRRQSGTGVPRCLSTNTLTTQEGLLLLCISVSFHVHLTVNGKRTVHDRHLPVGPQREMGIKVAVQRARKPENV